MDDISLRIQSYQDTISKIQEVLNKLLGVWNGKAFDKLCVKLNSFFNQVNIENTNLSTSDRRLIIPIYQDMKGIGVSLSDYKKRLIDHINSLGSEEVSLPSETVPDISVPEGNTNTETTSLTNENVRKLTLTNGNAPAYEAREDGSEIRSV